MPDPTRWSRVHLDADAREPFAPAFQRRAAGLTDAHPIHFQQPADRHRTDHAGRLGANAIALRVLAGIATGSALTWLATGLFW